MFVFFVKQGILASCSMLDLCVSLPYLVMYAWNSCTWNSICPLGVNLYQTRGIRSSKAKSKSTMDLDIIKLCDMSVPSLTTYPLLLILFLLLLSLVFCIFQLAAQFYFCFCYFHLHKVRGIYIVATSVWLSPPCTPLVDLHIEYDDGIIETRRVTRVKWILQSPKNWNIPKNRSRRRWQNVRLEFVRFIR